MRRAGPRGISSEQLGRRNVDCRDHCTSDSVEHDEDNSVELARRDRGEGDGGSIGRQAQAATYDESSTRRLHVPVLIAAGELALVRGCDEQHRKISGRRRSSVGELARQKLGDDRRVQSDEVADRDVLEIGLDVGARG